MSNLQNVLNDAVDESKQEIHNDGQISITESQDQNLNMPSTSGINGNGEYYDFDPNLASNLQDTNYQCLSQNLNAPDVTDQKESEFKNEDIDCNTCNICDGAKYTNSDSKLLDCENSKVPKVFRKRGQKKIRQKDICASKKKKSSWSFKLNCRQKVNSDDSESTSCVSCICGQNKNSNSDVQLVPDNQVPSTSSSTTYEAPIVKFYIEENPPQLQQSVDSSNEENVELRPWIAPCIRENHNPLNMTFNFDWMLDLQSLVESSLRLGLPGPKPCGITFANESIMHSFLRTESASSQNNVHTQVDYIHCLVPDLLSINNCAFYWGKMDRYEAEKLLENKPEGTFLLRDSAQEEYLFSVSFRRYRRSLHARIEQWNHKFSFDSHDPGVFASDTVCGLIEHYKDPQCCMFFEPLLTNPLPRSYPFPLEHLCRATICSRVSYDTINSLELPKSMKNYMKEYHYKQRVRVRHLELD